MSQTTSTSDERIAAAIAAYFVELESGREVDRSEFLTRFPVVASELTEFWLGHDRMMGTGNQPASDGREGAQDESSEALQHGHLLRSIEPSFQQATQACEASHSQSQSPSESDQGKELATSSIIAVGLPRQFGPYTLLSLIDQGGMGVVYRALDTRLNRVVALKTMRSGAFAGPEEVARFRVETATAAALHHPAIVPIHEVGEIEGHQYCTMSFIDGESLAKRIERTGPLAPEEAMRLVAKVSRAIEAAHRAGIVHRDLKPGNILIDSAGAPYVIDFGLAKNLSDQGMTTTGEIIGTPAYMAPEQATGRRGEATTAADVYGLGVVLYTLLSGQPPFLGATPFEILLQVLDREPPRLAQLRPGISRDLERICRRAMAKSPSDRYSSAAQFAEDLERLLRDEPIAHPRLNALDGFRHWFRREPILVCHLTVLVGVAAIVGLSANLREWRLPSGDAGPWELKLTLIAVWIGCCWLLQQATLRRRWHDVACLTWAALDVLGGTTLIALADPPRGLLTMTYPLLIVASGLFYRVSWVAFMTTVCIVGFLGLVSLAPEPEFARVDFCAMFVLGLLTMGMAVASIIRRVRGLLRYCDRSD